MCVCKSGGEIYAFLYEITYGLAAWLQLVHPASVAMTMDHCRNTTRYAPLCNFSVPISRSVLMHNVIHDICINIHTYNLQCICIKSSLIVVACIYFRRLMYHRLWTNACHEIMIHNLKY